MASTIKLKDTIEWSKRLNFGRSPVIGNALEPALTSANIIMQAILGPPFAWRWNRIEVSPTLAITNQDVVVSVPTFGWIETASVQDISTNGGNKWYQIQSKLVLARDSSQARPRFICPQKDDNNGNITFRVTPAPDQNYPLNVNIQQKSPIFTNIYQTWSPIPDEFSYVYTWGFMAMMWMFADDPRFAMANQKFVSHLLSSSEGLTETQVNIFLGNWYQITGQSPANSARVQQGEAARQV